MRFGDLSGTPDMLCSSVFDRDDEFFATAGVSRKIKVSSLWQYTPGPKSPAWPCIPPDAHCTVL